MMAFIQKHKWQFVQIIALPLLAGGTVSGVLAQSGPSETVEQKAIKQFETTPLQVTNLGDHIFLFSGDGGNVVAVVVTQNILQLCQQRAPWRQYGTSRYRKWSTPR